MISPDLHSLGFDYPEWGDLVNAMCERPLKTVIDAGPFAAVSIYQDESGAAVSIFRYQDYPPYTSPSLQGTRGHHVKAYQIYPSLALLDIYEDGDIEDPTYRLLAVVDDPHRYPIYEFGKEGVLVEYDDYRLSAVALDVQIYPNEDEWKKNQTPIDMSDSPDPDLPDEMYIGPKFVTSPCLFALYSGDAKPEEAGANAVFKGVVEKAELKTNHLTGQQWWCCEVDCGFPIITALPGDIEPAPAAGSVIDGDVFILGSSGFWDN